jgi:hypothetical protein
MRTTHKLIAVLIGVGAIVALALPAQARIAPAALNLGAHGTGSAQAQYHVADSPADHNNARIKLAVIQDNDSWAYAQPTQTWINGATLGAVHNLRFDVMTTGYVGAGSPRISVDVDTNGDGQADTYAYLSALYCQAQIGTSNWATADFMRTDAGCEIYVSDGGHYVSDGTTSAWAQFAAAHPTAKVTDAYVVMDETGQAFIDRIRIGHADWDRGTIS